MAKTSAADELLQELMAVFSSQPPGLIELHRVAKQLYPIQVARRGQKPGNRTLIKAVERAVELGWLAQPTAGMYRSYRVTGTWPGDAAAIAADSAQQAREAGSARARERTLATVAAADDLSKLVASLPEDGEFSEDQLAALEEGLAAIKRRITRTRSMIAAVREIT
ncbi:hypothetical protein [Miltoncostaea oceani]|uniref:hypothetical protein n=1 Tax=Miltoncostaea oceani TaxID=2843216 RepID=UPI001C3C5409|nr:hypothetical protein [Miltoncostaea oceani]